MDETRGRLTPSSRLFYPVHFEPSSQSHSPTISLCSHPVERDAVPAHPTQFATHFRSRVAPLIYEHNKHVDNILCVSGTPTSADLAKNFGLSIRPVQRQGEENWRPENQCGVASSALLRVLTRATRRVTQDKLLVSTNPFVRSLPTQTPEIFSRPDINPSIAQRGRRIRSVTQFAVGNLAIRAFRCDDHHRPVAPVCNQRIVRGALAT